MTFMSRRPAGNGCVASNSALKRGESASADIGTAEKPAAVSASQKGLAMRYFK